MRIGVAAASLVILLAGTAVLTRRRNIESSHVPSIQRHEI